MLPHLITKGYDDPNTSVVREVNGITVKNLSHLVEILRDAQESQIVFKFAKAAHQARETLVFNRAEMLSATEEILNDNGIRFPYSEDIRPIWEKNRSAEKDRVKPKSSEDKQDQVQLR
jgi:hypothetical protein